MKLDPSQEAAVELMLRAPLATVTGGPGTGKSTITRAMRERLPSSTEVAYCAPTGKAAARLSEAVGEPASTVHRLLGYQGPGRIAFTRSNPLDVDVVVLDEASMLDVELAQLLFAAICPPTRVILIGDANQLPPVGPGAVFAELCAAPDLVPCARLEHLHRAAAASWVARNAPSVLRGGPIELETCEDFEWIQTDAATDALEAVVQRAQDDARLQVLIPQRTGLCGCEAANKRLARPVSEGAPALRRDAGTITVGDRVIITRNLYAFEPPLFNGDSGEVVDISGGAITVDVADLNGVRTVELTTEQANSLLLSYALTVHRAQGSQFDGVLVVAHSSHFRMLTRRLFYTAITRTRSRVILVGDRRGVERALANKADQARNTTLVARLRDELEAVIVPP